MKPFFEDVARKYFKTGKDEILNEVYNTMNDVWPQPDYLPEIHRVEMFGKKYEVTPHNMNR